MSATGERYAVTIVMDDEQYDLTMSGEAPSVMERVEQHRASAGAQPISEWCVEYWAPESDKARQLSINGRRTHRWDASCTASRLGEVE